MFMSKKEKVFVVGLWSIVIGMIWMLHLYVEEIKWRTGLPGRALH